MNNIKLTITELRKMKGITQTELANYLGVTFQSVSKWENQTTMPDITLLPKMAEYFNVSVDQILGLTPLDGREYMRRNTHHKSHWENQMQYLKSLRKVAFWNKDYLQFLVEKVWNINEPISVAEFGCRDGYMAQQLLEVLPEGSRYTGIDNSDKLLKLTRQRLGDTDNVTLINSELMDVDIEAEFDVVLTHCCLRHQPNPYSILDRMINAVKKDGLVICTEVNRKFENSGTLIKGIDYNTSNHAEMYQKFWNSELKNEGRDYAIGMRLPIYMKEKGLKNIDIRMNDKVNFINPSDSDYNEIKDAFIDLNHWSKHRTADQKEGMIKHYMNRGISRNEVEEYIDTLEQHTDFMERTDDVTAVATRGLMISYGRK